MNRTFRIASVCGSGYATSGWIKAKLNEAFEEKGIQADIREVKVMDLAASASNFDLIVSASALNDVYGVPVVASSSIITGIGFADTFAEIIGKLKAIETGQED